MNPAVGSHRPADDARGNVAQLRNHIDRGRAGDKIAWPDPAMAPLGTDDEAADAAPAAERVDRAVAAELERPNTAVMNAGGPRKIGTVVWVYTLFILCLALLFGWGAILSG